MYIDTFADKHGFADGMRDKAPALCWHLFEQVVCILHRGHGGGEHELPDDMVWVAAGGRRIPLDDMEEGHIVRAINYMTDKLEVASQSDWETLATPAKATKIRRNVTDWTASLRKLEGEQLRRLGVAV